MVWHYSQIYSHDSMQSLNFYTFCGFYIGKKQQNIEAVLLAYKDGESCTVDVRFTAWWGHLPVSVLSVHMFYKLTIVFKLSKDMAVNAMCWEDDQTVVLRIIVVGREDDILVYTIVRDLCLCIYFVVYNWTLGLQSEWTVLIC